MYIPSFFQGFTEKKVGDLESRFNIKIEYEIHIYLKAASAKKFNFNIKKIYSNYIQGHISGEILCTFLFKFDMQIKNTPILFEPPCAIG